MGHKVNNHLCPGRGKRCRKCNGTGYFEIVCKIKHRPSTGQEVKAQEDQMGEERLAAVRVYGTLKMSSVRRLNVHVAYQVVEIFRSQNFCSTLGCTRSYDYDSGAM